MPNDLNSTNDNKCTFLYIYIKCIHLITMKYSSSYCLIDNLSYITLYKHVCHIDLIMFMVHNVKCLSIIKTTIT